MSPSSGICSHWKVVCPASWCKCQWTRKKVREYKYLNYCKHSVCKYLERFSRSEFCEDWFLLNNKTCIIYSVDASFYLTLLCVCAIEIHLWCMSLINLAKIPMKFFYYFIQNIIFSYSDIHVPIWSFIFLLQHTSVLLFQLLSTWREFCVCQYRSEAAPPCVALNK